MRSIMELYENQLEWINKIILSLQENLKKEDTDFEEACAEMWGIINDFQAQWEFEDDNDADEYQEQLVKEAEESFNDMIADMDQEDIDYVLSEYNNDMEEYKKSWIEEEVENLKESGEPYNEEYGGYNETLYVEIKQGDAFYDFDNREDMEDILESAIEIKEEIEREYQIAFRD